MMSVRVHARSAAVLLLAVASLLAGSATAQANKVAASSGPLRVEVSYHGGTVAHPRINQSWSISVTARLNGHSTTASAYYQFFFQGQLVSTAYIVNNPHFRFSGHFRDPLTFPGSALGHLLTMRVVVSAGGHTAYPAFQIQAVR